MKKEVAEANLQFLARVSLQGIEVPSFNVVTGALRDILDGPEVTRNQGQSSGSSLGELVTEQLTARDIRTDSAGVPTHRAPEKRVTRHCMLDLETLGLRPGCAILSIGAVMFTEHGLSDISFKRNITIESNLAAGLTIDPETEEWWKKQPKEAREALKDPAPVSLENALFEFASFYAENGALKIWSHGAATDLPWLGAAYHAIGREEPWHYQSPRDTRTIFDLCELAMQVRTEPRIAHCALEDARAQATDVVRCMQFLRMHVPAS